MRLIEKTGVSVIVIAGGMLYLAEYLHLPSLIPIAIGVFGLFGVWLGVDTFIHGEIRLWNRLYSRREDYSGVTARLLGTLIFLFGAGVSLFAFLEWTQPGMAGNYLAGLVGSSRGWGILLIAFGFFTLLFGVIRLFAGSAHRPEERRGIVDFSYRVRGSFNIVVGLIALAGGVWLVLK